MNAVNAWLLDLGEGLFAAVGEQEMVHILPDDPRLFEIPQTPAYCRNVLVWSGEIIPLMNLTARISGRSVTYDQGLVVITAFQEYPGALTQHAALRLRTPPMRIRVDDAQACDLPDPQPIWRDLAAACFEHAEYGPVPVLDLAKVFLLPQEATDRRVEEKRRIPPLTRSNRM